MSRKDKKVHTTKTYYVDEAGDGVLFGKKGRLRLNDSDAQRYFVLGMVSCSNPKNCGEQLEELRANILKNPLYSGIQSVRSEAKKTAKHFHAKDDHAEVRAKVFELLIELDFKFYALIKDMRKVLEYVRSRNEMDSTYRYQPNELYDLTVRMLFKNRLHKCDHYKICFAKRGKSDRTKALRTQLELAKARFQTEHYIGIDSQLTIHPCYPWQESGLQIADYCLWALQRTYEKHEDRFMRALWEKVSVIHDVDDPIGKSYGTYCRSNSPFPDMGTIKSR